MWSSQSAGPLLLHPRYAEYASIQKALSMYRGPAPNSPFTSSSGGGVPVKFSECTFALPLTTKIASWGGEIGGYGSVGGGT